mmetsp:Transcript_8549/g.22878  ORF Transcript_8549/g.22878 Transcript_8549/m.22878 type:complete len:166 (+) Transcript_8549:2317-2814(+)
MQRFAQPYDLFPSPCRFSFVVVSLLLYPGHWALRGKGCLCVGTTRRRRYKYLCCLCKHRGVPIALFPIHHNVFMYYSFLFHLRSSLMNAPLGSGARGSAECRPASSKKGGERDSSIDEWSGIVKDERFHMLQNLSQLAEDFGQGRAPGRRASNPARRIRPFGGGH